MILTMSDQEPPQEVPELDKLLKEKEEENEANTVITGTPFKSDQLSGKIVAGARAWEDSKKAGAGRDTQEVNTAYAMDPEKTEPLSPKPPTTLPEE